MSDISTNRYRDLQRLARANNQPADQVMTLYALEGFLARLMMTQHSETFVLKGGMLLAAFASRRPTKDIDVQALEFDNDVDHVLEVVADILAVNLHDGLVFDLHSVAVTQIRDAEAYSGLRVAVETALATARLKMRLDINVGDPITPAPTLINVPRLLDDAPITMLGYPLTMVFAEKTMTAVERGVANTRWRDFADILLLSRAHDVDGDELIQAVNTVARHRGVAIRTLTDVLDGFADQAQDRWWRWVRKFQLDDRLPERFSEIVESVQAFADPALSGDASGKRWISAKNRWI
jgi:hypothetical protein